MWIEEVMQDIENQLEKYTNFLCDICVFEGRAEDKETIDDMIDRIAAFSQNEGFKVKRTPMENCGDFLTIEINDGAPKGCMLLAHTDTVHKKGAFGQPPVRIEKDRIIGPGTIDCKGGIAIALLTMKALKTKGYTKHVRLILTSDEEISNTLGGEKEICFIKDSSAGFPYAINCETSEKDEVVVSRKGICKYQIDVEGISGHSGIHYFECRNPIEEAAHKIIALQEKSQPGGITYSCNIIHGGVLENIIPKTCSIRVDVRFPLRKDLEEIEQTVSEIVNTNFIEETSSTLTRISQRPPMEKNPATDALFQKLLSVCKKHNLGSLTPIESGGSSDSCHTQAAGIPSICGMGGCGEFCHTNQEYILTESIGRRAKLIAALLITDN